MSDRHIILINDEKIFEQIFKDHYNDLVNFSRRYVKDPDLAEEIVQEMFSNLWIKSDRIEIKSSLKSYLFGAVRNACLNHLKHEKIKDQHASFIRQTETKSFTNDFLEFDELSSRINTALKKIPEKCRQVFELSRFEGKKYHEIAHELNISVKTVENQMGKALKILREELKDYIFLLTFLIGNGGNF